MKTMYIATALAAVCLTPSFVLAADAAPTPTHSFTPNVGVVSNYLFRGVSQTHGNGALQGGIDYAHASGLYAGVWASTITWVKDGYGSGTTEVDYYGGYKNTFGEGGNWNYDLGGIHYSYPGKGAPIAGTNVDPKTSELYGALGYRWVTLKYSRVISPGFIGWLGNNGNTNTRGSDYIELNVAHDLGQGWGLTGHVGKQKVKNVIALASTASADYQDWNVGLTKDTGAGVIGLMYSKTNAKGSCASSALPATNASAYCWGTDKNTKNFVDVAKAAFVLTYKYSF